MRRFLIFLFCCLLLTTAVSAASSATDVASSTTVYSDGTCQVALTVQLKFEEVPANLSFPLPQNARNISLNGGGARTWRSGGVRYVDLSGVVNYPGNYTITLHYSLPDSVVAQRNKLYLELDLLSGFAYPIDQMRFTVTLPGAPEFRPEFSSIYHQEAVDSFMDCQIEGNTISCSFRQGLNDHEALTMRLQVTESQFPQPIMKKWRLSADDIAMYICFFLALAYWVLTMRALPPRRRKNALPPEGVTAGELGCLLTGRGVDFTMMVISWAQMGYILIHLDDNGRVLLHKRMDMGNERSDFENRCFRTLFGRRSTVDGTGYHFARLARKAARTVPGAGNYYRRHTGNPNIFRALCACAGIFGGISMAAMFADDTAWQVVLSVFLAALGTVVSWLIQAGATTVHLRRSQNLILALGGSALWILLGLWAGEVGVSLLLVGVQWLCGLAAGYGGRRNEVGRQMLSDVLGLRRYLRTVPKEELQRIIQLNPEYYYDLAPYAMALGVDMAFARQMGNRKLPQCTYLTTGMDGHLTAREWNRLLRDAVSALDERQQRMKLDKLLGR